MLWDSNLIEGYVDSSVADRSLFLSMQPPNLEKHRCIMLVVIAINYNWQKFLYVLHTVTTDCQIEWGFCSLYNILYNVIIWRYNFDELMAICQISWPHQSLREKGHQYFPHQVSKFIKLLHYVVSCSHNGKIQWIGSYSCLMALNSTENSLPIIIHWVYHK